MPSVDTQRINCAYDMHQRNEQLSKDHVIVIGHRRYIRYEYKYSERYNNNHIEPQRRFVKPFTVNPDMAVSGGQVKRNLEVG